MDQYRCRWYVLLCTLFPVLLFLVRAPCGSVRAIFSANLASVLLAGFAAVLCFLLRISTVEEQGVKLHSEIRFHVASCLFCFPAFCGGI